MLFVLRRRRGEEGPAWKYWEWVTGSVSKAMAARSLQISAHGLADDRPSPTALEVWAGLWPLETVEPACK